MGSAIKVSIAIRGRKHLILVQVHTVPLVILGVTFFRGTPEVCTTTLGTVFGPIIDESTPVSFTEFNVVDVPFTSRQRTKSKRIQAFMIISPVTCRSESPTNRKSFFDHAEQGVPFSFTRKMPAFRTSGICSSPCVKATIFIAIACAVAITITISHFKVKILGHPSLFANFHRLVVRPSRASVIEPFSPFTPEFSNG